MAAILKHLADRVFRRRRRVGRPSSVLLTFDDGPHPVVTGAVLDRLKKYDARAVFFVVGSRIEKAPEMIGRVLADGHLLGNHTFSHELGRDPWLPAYYLDVRRCQKMLEKLTGRAPRFFRAPMGRSSPGALLTPLLLGMTPVVWSADSDDWRLRSHEAAVNCAERLCDTVTAGDIILFHDDNPWVLTVLDILLPALAAQGLDLRHGIEAI